MFLYSAAQAKHSSLKITISKIVNQIMDLIDKAIVTSDFYVNVSKHIVGTSPQLLVTIIIDISENTYINNLLFDIPNKFHNLLMQQCIAQLQIAIASSYGVVYSITDIKITNDIYTVKIELEVDE